jgi:hypothetical protein
MQVNLTQYIGSYHFMYQISCSFALFRLYQSIRLGPRHMFKIPNYASFYSEELSATPQTPKLEEHSLLDVHHCLFNIITATLDIGGHSSIHRSNYNMGIQVHPDV